MTAPHSSARDSSAGDSPAWYDATATRTPAVGPRTDTHTVRTHAVSGRPADAAPAPVAPAPAVGKPARTVRLRVAAAIGVVAFLLGAGVSMLAGPLLGGGPGGPGGPGGGQGGPPGTSQQATTGSGTTSS